MTEVIISTTCPVCTAEHCQQGCRCMCHASKPVEHRPEVRKTPCCGYEFKTPDPGPIFWNPYNEVVQCHNCGASFDERKPIEQQPDWKELYEGAIVERDIMESKIAEAREAGRREGLEEAIDLLRNDGVLIPIVVGETKQDIIVRFALAMADRIEVERLRKES